MYVQSYMYIVKEFLDRSRAWWFWIDRESKVRCANAAKWLAGSLLFERWTFFSMFQVKVLSTIPSLDHTTT